MKLSTASTYDDSKYDVVGIVMGMQTRSVSMIREFFASVGTIFGGKSNLINTRLLKAREDAIEELRKNAEAMGADMVVGIDVDTGSLDLGGTPVFTFVATGTALRAKTSSSITGGGKKRRITHRKKHL
jgi:uncharacterized protein YbjQ (UPF0145 family)